MRSYPMFEAKTTMFQAPTRWEVVPSGDLTRGYPMKKRPTIWEAVVAVLLLPFGRQPLGNPVSPSARLHLATLETIEILDNPIYFT